MVQSIKLHTDFKDELDEALSGLTDEEREALFKLSFPKVSTIKGKLILSSTQPINSNKQDENERNINSHSLYK